MNDQKNIPKNVKFIYEKADDYKVIYVNGAQGGITMNGELRFDLFLEHPSFPKSDTHSINEDGSLGPRIEVKLEGDFPEDCPEVVRERKIGIILEPQHARVIANWILGKVDQI